MTMDISKLKLSAEEKERMASLRDSLTQKKHVLSRVAGTDTGPGMYTVDLKQSLQAAGALDEMAESTKSAILAEYKTCNAGIEDLMRKIREESMALVNMILSVEGQNDPETVDTLVKGFREGVKVYTAKGVAALNILAADAAPLKASISPPSVVLPGSGPFLTSTPEHKFTFTILDHEFFLGEKTREGSGC